MDTSEVFIKQCDCPEIQEQWLRILEGDFTNKGVISELDTYYPDGHWDLVVDNTVYQSTELIWLPRQDDLEKMVINKYDSFLDMLEDFYWHWTAYKTEETYPWREYLSNVDKEKILSDFTSMKQLWLAFYMKTCHNKIWEDKWV